MSEIELNYQSAESNPESVVDSKNTFNDQKHKWEKTNILISKNINGGSIINISSEELLKATGVANFPIDFKLPF